MTAKVEIYTTAICPYCVNAKRLLDQKGVKYTEIHVDQDQDQAKRQEMVKRSGGKRTVPQIFINGQSIGGYDDLRALEEKKELDNLLK